MEHTAHEPQRVKSVFLRFSIFGKRCFWRKTMLVADRTNPMQKGYKTSGALPESRICSEISGGTASCHWSNLWIWELFFIWLFVESLSLSLHRPRFLSVPSNVLCACWSCPTACWFRSLLGRRNFGWQILARKEPHYIEVPALDLNQDENVTLARLPMLDVQDVLAYVHDTVGLRSPNEHVEMYWSWGKRNGAGWSRLGGSGVVPVGLYADETKYGGPFSDEKVLGVFINLVLHRPASIRYSRFCIFACRSALILGNRTLYPIFHRIVWGFHLAFKGLRADGELLCKDGTKFLCTELRGDLAWHKCIWGFEKKGWQAKDVCWFCDAKNQGNACLYTEIGENADWVETIVENTWEWANNTLPQHNLCNLLALPGFHVHTVRLCSMHNVNLGLLQVCNGSALILWNSWGL